MKQVRGIVAAAVSVGLVLAPAVCLAQAAMGGENGIKVGEGRLHPYFDLELRLDTAAGLFGLPANGSPSSELILHARPGLRLEMPQSESMQVNANGYVEYVWYSGLLSPTSRAASRFQGALSLDAAFNRNGPVEIDIGDHFIRSDRTTNVAIAVGILSLFNEAKLAVPVHPGGGALEVTPSVAWAVEFFQPLSIAVPGCTRVECDPTQVAGMSYNNFQFGLAGRWRFLPKTALVLESTFDTRTYASATNPPPLLLRAQLGLQGLLTPKVSTIAKVGWGHDFAASGAKTVIGHLEFAYLMNEASTIKVGYLRSLAPVPTFGVNGDDKAYVDGKFFFGGRLSVRGYAAFDYLSFYSGSGRNDTVVTFDVGPDYQFTPWLIAGAGYTMQLRSVNLVNTQTANLVRHEAYLRLTLTY